MSRIIKVSDALRELAQGASDAEREPLRQVLLEIAGELQPSPVEKIRMATRMPPDQEAANEGHSGARQVNGVTQLTTVERGQVQDQLLSIVRAHGRIRWKELREQVLEVIPWLEARQKDWESTLRTYCAKLYESRKVSYEGEFGKHNAPMNRTIVCDTGAGDGDASPFPSLELAHDHGTESGASRAIETTSDGVSQEESTGANGDLSHHRNGWPSVTSTAQANGHNGVSAGQ